ncbi:hypothetical protein DQ04_00711160 [Trypanosoma grayi]|uniref:hypothetical protein n=1 Tax=Trypanosoma grayi TaxID=71804 RepID=UPI0004F402A7|nr:hypothetical protein DQ04_00711160 [Trypanosoma grayi]KEG13938.1 hypothetical protein DQ04_00711160 [Trypanosoma grayi]
MLQGTTIIATLDAGAYLPSPLCQCRFAATRVYALDGAACGMLDPREGNKYPRRREREKEGDMNVIAVTLDLRRALTACRRATVQLSFVILFTERIMLHFQQEELHQIDGQNLLSIRQ